MTWELLLEAAFVVSQSLVLATIHSFTVVTLGPCQDCKLSIIYNNEVDNSMYFQLQRPGRMDHPSERGQAGPCTSSPLDPPLSNSLQTK